MFMSFLMLTTCGNTEKVVKSKPEIIGVEGGVFVVDRETAFCCLFVKPISSSTICWLPYETVHSSICGLQQARATNFCFGQKFPILLAL